MSPAAVPIANALRDNWFWAGIFRDHATFIHSLLSPDQEQAVRWANGFKQAFTSLHAEAQSLAQTAGLPGPTGTYAVAGLPAESPMASLQGAELTRYEQSVATLNRQLIEALSALRGYKEQLLQQKLDCQIKLNASPSLLSHMIMEADEAYRTLNNGDWTAKIAAPLEMLHHHLVWLPDTAGHAAVLNDGIDPAEQALKQTTAAFKQSFDGLHMKTNELYSMLRGSPRMVGALGQLNKEAMNETTAFRNFLTDLREKLQGCAVLTATVSADLADHMLREELYYTEKVMSALSRQT